MITENLSTLKIHKLTQAQYDRELEAGRIDANALYLTPDTEINMSEFIDATLTQEGKAADSKAVGDKFASLVGDTKVSTQITNAINDITHPVSSVNGKTGAVSLSASDVGAPSISDFTGHTGNSTVHITSTERENWNLAKTKAESAYNLANSKLDSSSEINGGTW